MSLAPRPSSWTDGAWVRWGGERNKHSGAKRRCVRLSGNKPLTKDTWVLVGCQTPPKFRLLYLISPW